MDRWQADITRFWSKVAKSDGCWLWTGLRHDRGDYGLIHISHPRKHKYRAHRFSYELANGPIPEGLCVCHRCDNPPCVRPDHLFLGTNAENHADSAAKGRAYRPRGELCGKAKLTAPQVREMRSLQGRLSHGEIARRFGVHRATVRGILYGLRWKHLCNAVELRLEDFATPVVAPSASTP